MGRIISVNKEFKEKAGVMAAEAVGLLICEVLVFSEENPDFSLSPGAGESAPLFLRHRK